MKKRILIIDDEPDFTHLMRRSLELHGYYHVAEENDPADALTSARAFGPDLILLDIMMPDADGSELAADLRRDPLLRGTPVLFMTALVSGTDAPGGTCSSGGHVFLPKTIGTGRLITCIEETLAEALAEAPARQAADRQPVALAG